MSLPLTWTLLGDYFIPHRIQMLARMIDRETGRELQSEFNLSVADWRVLGFVNTVGISSAVDICAAFEVDRAEVSRAVVRLVKAGLVQRTPDPENRAKKKIAPTDAGRDVFEQVREMRVAYFSRIMEGLDLEKRKVLDQAILSIAHHVDALRCADASAEREDEE